MYMSNIFAQKSALYSRINIVCTCMHSYRTLLTMPVTGPQTWQKMFLLPHSTLEVILVPCPASKQPRASHTAWSAIWELAHGPPSPPLAIRLHVWTNDFILSVVQSHLKAKTFIPALKDHTQRRGQMPDIIVVQMGIRAHSFWEPFLKGIHGEGET